MAMGVPALSVVRGRGGDPARDAFWSGFALLQLTRTEGSVVFPAIDQLAAASVVGLTVGFGCYAALRWRDAKREEAAAYRRQVTEMSKAREIAKAAVPEVPATDVESVPESVADYWDREDLITLLFEERVIKPGVDRPWAPRLIAARSKREMSGPVH